MDGWEGGELRRDLKMRLMQERLQCDWCGKWLHGVGDLHEWLVKRNVLPKNNKIFDERNCALLHHNCHMRYGQTRAMTEKLAPIFMKRYGRDAMVAFIEGLELRQPSQFMQWLR